jgi:Zn-dependent protease with chaperone function
VGLRSRRDFMMASLCGCALAGSGRDAQARILAIDLPLVSAGYRPTEEEERSLWQACEDLERQVAASKLRLRDAALDGYIRGVMERLLGTRAAELRPYVLHNPDFNASMTPNGMLLVYTGLLARIRNEAQLAAVLGHESGHYLRRHSLQNWRKLKQRTASMAVVEVLGAFTGLGILLAGGINASLALSLYSYSRELESEADAVGLQLLTAAGYPPQAASEIWKQLIGERQASAAERHKAYRDSARSVLSTHPPSEERLHDLQDTAAALAAAADGGRDARRREWLQAAAPLRASLIEEQVKLNDPGASLYLLHSLAEDGWGGLLRYYEGEVYRLRAHAGDDALAAQDYAAAVQLEDAPPEAFRQHGYALLRAGQVDDGRRALQRYLELLPQSADADMVRFSLSH